MWTINMNSVNGFVVLIIVFGNSNSAHTYVENETSIEDIFIYDDTGNLIKANLMETHDEEKFSHLELLDQVFFYLYTRDTSNSPENLIIDNITSIINSHFDPKRPTKFTTHGWMNSYKSTACTLVRDAFLEHDDYNVIVIDWSKISFKPYIWASNHVVMVAQVVAKMIEFLESHGMKPSDVTVVGHSLGAHVASLSSHYAKNKVHYVVGLDPAGPNFHDAGEGERMSENDAEYVQAIHTSQLLGIILPVGIANFYPNGGWQQTCLVDPVMACSHLRAVKYYAESINCDGFLARKCESYDEYLIGNCSENPVGRMGGVKPQFNVTGKYFLETNVFSPFAKDECDAIPNEEDLNNKDEL